MSRLTPFFIPLLVSHAADLRHGDTSDGTLKGGQLRRLFTLQAYITDPPTSIPPKPTPSSLLVHWVDAEPPYSSRAAAYSRSLGPWPRDEEHDNLSVIDQLTILQSQLRENAVVPLAALVRPFARLLKDPSLSAPFKLSALEALNGIAALQQDESSAEAVLGEVVDAVIECRFVQTDAHLDEIVALSTFETLSRLLSGSLRRLVNDETFWRIVLMCHSTVVSQADNSPSTAAHSAHRLLFFALNALLEYSAAYEKVGLPRIPKCLSHFVAIPENFFHLKKRKFVVIIFVTITYARPMISLKIKRKSIVLQNDLESV